MSPGPGGGGIRIRNTLPEIARGAAKFGKIAVGKADKTMAEAGQATLLAADEIVHVITDSLRQSGKVFIEPIPSGVRVIVEFGGDSTGPKNPVEYAIYEFGRGGDHDFMTPAIVATKDEYAKGVRKALISAFREAF